MQTRSKIRESVDTTRVPRKLVAQSELQFAIVRDLSETEISDHLKYVPIIGEARDRLKLFKILQGNYREWREYLNGLLNSRAGNHEQEALELDRLVLNYLTCAYTIREHFKVSFVQRFRNDAQKRNGHRDFIDGLCKHSWAFAFFLDFRGYVQHRGLGIGCYQRKISGKSVTISITQDTAKLVEESREWKQSKLSGSKGRLDLISLLREFHVQMLQSYAKFVAQTFFPEITPAASFYQQLVEEVQQKKPGYRIVFLRGEPKARKKHNKTTIKMELEQVPNDVFQELGISIPKNVRM
jgi:hypothetical protein